MHCLNRQRIRTTDGLKRFTDCRVCEPCRLSRQYAWANRLQWEIKQQGEDRCFFFTGTFDRAHLPWSDHIPAGQLNEAQEKLYAKLSAKKHRSAKSRDFAVELMRRMDGENEAKPTVRRKVMQDWKKRLRERIGFLPRILCNGEYGTLRGRPHHHALIMGITAEQAEAGLAAWPFSEKVKEMEPVRSEKIGSYISKDVVKGTWSKQNYIAEGREPPFMLWPQSPQLAAGQEEEVYRALSALRAATNDYDFEHRVQLQHVGRTFAVRENGKRHDVAFGETAYKKALARIPRNEEVRAMVAEEAARQAHFQVTHTDPEHPHYLAAHGEHQAQQKEKAEVRAARARRRHGAILDRKGIERG